MKCKREVEKIFSRSTQLDIEIIKCDVQEGSTLCRTKFYNLGGGGGGIDKKFLGDC